MVRLFWGTFGHPADEHGTQHTTICRGNSCGNRGSMLICEEINHKGNKESLENVLAVICQKPEVLSFSNKNQYSVHQEAPQSTPPDPLPPDSECRFVWPVENTAYQSLNRWVSHDLGPRQRRRVLVRVPRRKGVVLAQAGLGSSK